MINPWFALPTAGPFVLPEDSAAVDAFNARLPARSPCRIDVEAVIPEPFVGAVLTAPVIVLQLNPGSDETNAAAHAVPEFRVALLANLRHELTDWPFYFLHPRFRVSQPGGRWWTGKTRKLAEVVPLKRLAERLAVVEWFPYKSPRYRLGCTVRSQEYGFSLVSDAMRRGALIVISRSHALWRKSVPALQDYRRQLTLASVQNVALTPNNLKYKGVKSPEAWSMLVEALE